MITTTTADNLLRSYYLDAITEQLDRGANPLLARIAQTTNNVVGKNVKKTIVYGMQGGIGAGAETGDLPKSGENKYLQATLVLKNLYGTIEITDKALRAAGNGEGAFINLLNDEMEGLIKCASFNLGRMLYGDGSGKLATIISSDPVRQAYYNVDAINNLAEGMIVDVYDSSNTLKCEKREITWLDRNIKQISISGSVISSPENHSIYLQGSKGLELTGLGQIFSDSASLYGVARGTWLKPYKKDEVGEINENEIQTAIDAIEERSGGKVNFIVCSWGVRRALVKSLTASRAMPPVELEGGFTALSFNGIPVVADRFCPEGTMYLLNTDDFALHQLCDWQWLEGEDGRILKQIPGKAIYTATLVKYVDLMCYRPCGQGRLTGITEA